MARNLASILVLVLGLAGDIRAGTPTPEVEEPFPTYDSIRGCVDFWVDVFSRWSQREIVVHDSRHPAIVYEVVELPGPLEQRYTKEQRKFVDDLRDRWEDRLRTLEDKVRRRRPLTQPEKALALDLAIHAGTDATIDAHERVRVQRGLRERFRRGLEISGRYDKHLREIFADAGLPEDLAYLPHVESSFQASARSSAGAVGAWQFTRGTGQLYLRIDAVVDERLDPIRAAHGAAAYLRDAHTELGSWPLALTSYNHGVAGMRRAAERFDSDYERIVEEYDGRRFGFASRNFYSEFLAARRIAQSPEAFFGESTPLAPPLDVESTRLERPASIARIAAAYRIDLERLVELNPAWTRRARRDQLLLGPGAELWLPGGHLEWLARENHDLDVALAALDVPSYHRVRTGDTLSTIAARYGLALVELRRLNDIASGEDVIRVGDRLRVGDGPVDGVHVVRRGQSLSTIASDYGMRLADLKALNGIPAHSSLIRAGQRLHVQGNAGQTVHVVRRGESLSRIAAAYRVLLADLLAFNRLTMSAVIHPGQTLQIPYGAGLR